MQYNESDIEDKEKLPPENNVPARGLNPSAIEDLIRDGKYEIALREVEAILSVDPHNYFASMYRSFITAMIRQRNNSAVILQDEAVTERMIPDRMMHSIDHRLILEEHEAQKQHEHDETSYTTAPHEIEKLESIIESVPSRESAPHNAQQIFNHTRLDYSSGDSETSAVSPVSHPEIKGKKQDEGKSSEASSIMDEIWIRYEEKLRAQMEEKKRLEHELRLKVEEIRHKEEELQNQF